MPDPKRPERKPNPKWPKISRGHKVTYHGVKDVPAEILLFDGIGNATLRLKNGTEVRHVPEGDDAGEWSSPVRKKVKPKTTSP